MATYSGETVIYGYLYMEFKRKHVSINMSTSIENSNKKQIDLVEKNT